MPLTNTRTPATHMHASCTDAQRKRSVRAALVTFLVVAGAGVVRAETPAITLAAEVTRPAERIRVGGEGVRFPIDPSPMCEVFNNFGGYSKAGRPFGHEGVDIGAHVGQAVYAVDDGVLYRAFTDLSSAAGLGWGLRSDADVVYRYYHLASVVDGLAEGDRVTAGQLIGTVGDTGNASPGGWHLHFEVRPGPQPVYGAADPVDPVPLLEIPATCHVY
ncbi:MAG: M23 family metallopeptidase [Ilumatobacteraceae bacterium]